MTHPTPDTLLADCTALAQRLITTAGAADPGSYTRSALLLAADSVTWFHLTQTNAASPREHPEILAEAAEACMALHRAAKGSAIHADWVRRAYRHLEDFQDKISRKLHSTLQQAERRRFGPNVELYPGGPLACSPPAPDFGGSPPPKK